MRRDELDGEVFEILLTFSDFLSFKEMFVDYKAVSRLDLSSFTAPCFEKHFFSIVSIIGGHHHLYFSVPPAHNPRTFHVSSQASFQLCLRNGTIDSIDSEALESKHIVSFFYFFVCK